MMNNKLYYNHPILYHTKCININDTAFLRTKWYPVVGITDTQLLIRFNSGGANWYSKDRFVGKYNDTKY